MNRYYQQGMSTLLITSMLLVVALIFSLASYKNLFYQIKRTQNEVLARQAHWAAEGGLECGFAKIYQDRDLSKLDSTLHPNYLKSECISKLNLSSIDIEPLIDGKQYKLLSIFDTDGLYKAISKIIDVSPKASTGTIKSTADIFVYGTATFNPPDPGEEVDDGWKCKVARYKRYFKISGSIHNQEFTDVNNLPYSDFVSNNKHCITSHKSTSTTNLLQDFENDTDIDPFYELFNVDKSKWVSVRDSAYYDFAIIKEDKVENITGSNEFVKRVTDCGNKIAKEIKDNKKLNIWVDGSCELEGTGLVAVKDASDKTENGVLILVHNGVFSINGAGSIKGVSFHFNQPSVFSPEEKDWKGLIAYGILNRTPTNFDVMLNNTYDPVPSVKTAAYFQNGAFSFSGGQFYDLDGQMALFNNGLDLKYNRDYIERSMQMGEPRWQKGSWHDF
ncbi:hypothetical protein [Photobacterium damselae]|uniref:hypothetical protein n=1 Tax=Photobacterium damselae TaxID=38293 RepID=UPI0015946F3D|nr:hypothetical protein [Photobacterium damselae]NVH46571.1 hypothetical protein [Photobacterium damselae subsp. damselae]